MRLFIALEIPEAAKEHLACVMEDLRFKLPRGKWVNPMDMHITLAFLGETDPDMVALITETLETVAERARSLELYIDKLGAFPNPARASVVWAGLTEKLEGQIIATESKAERLSALARNVRKQLAGTEPPVDFDPKPFKAHITLGRFDHADCGIIKETTINPFAMRLDSLVLFETVWLHGGGHRYEQRSTFRLH
jgi:2'-5' RNA ligase